MEQTLLFQSHFKVQRCPLSVHRRVYFMLLLSAFGVYATYSQQSCRPPLPCNLTPKLYESQQDGHCFMFDWSSNISVCPESNLIVEYAIGFGRDTDRGSSGSVLVPCADAVDFSCSTDSLSETFCSAKLQARLHGCSSTSSQCLTASLSNLYRTVQGKTMQY